MSKVSGLTKSALVALTGLAIHLLVAASSVAATGIDIRFVDDRTQTIEGSLEVCIVDALERTCSEVRGGEVSLPSSNFDFVRIEGEDHGPLTTTPAELQPDGGTQDGLGTTEVRVPRKAVLRIKSLPSKGGTLSLYPHDDPYFRRPLVRSKVSNDAEIKVPSGHFLLSLTARGTAPDLRELVLAPGTRTLLKHRHREGWSLVLRVLDRETRSVVPRAEGKLRTSALDVPEGERPELQGTGRSSEAGLVLFFGVEEPVVDAVIEHPGFLPEEAVSLAATPGTFAFRDVEMSRGGEIAVEVTVGGEAWPGAQCSLLVYERTPGSAAAPREAWTSTADERGLCRGQRLREGDYVLRVQVMGLPGQQRAIDLPVTVVEGAVQELSAALERVVVEGEILQGTEPAKGHRLVVHDLEALKPYARDQDATAITKADDDGWYSVTLWRAGRYRLHLQNPTGSPASIKSVRLDPGTNTINFKLGPHQVEGRVVNADGEAVAEASISLNWNGTHFYRAFSDRDGAFAFSLAEESGSARLTAQASGYFRSDPVDLEVRPLQPPPPVVLTLKKNGGLTGQLIGRGGPVPGAVVLSYQEESFSNPRWLGQATTDGEGIFQLPRAKRGTTRIYYTGPGCPLGTALPPADPPKTDQRWQVPCAHSSSGVEVILLNPDHSPREGSTVFLRSHRAVYPRQVLATHLARAGLAFRTDANGRLMLGGLEPGTYDLYLAEANSPVASRLGADRGFLATVDLPPRAVRTVQAILEERFPKEKR